VVGEAEQENSNFETAEDRDAAAARALAD